MNDTSILADNISKRYRIGAKNEAYKTLRDSLTKLVAAPVKKVLSLGRGNTTKINRDTLWALKDVSFEIRRGDVVGIIGRNGAGKSTLLKVLSRITEPTNGLGEIHGRVASLLEVGTGFHNELTGRENIYLNGSIMGMRKKEIDAKIDEIAAFAMTEQFLDTPIKHYSSGMRLRLGFGVAAHLDPDILLVDEVLAVGDAEFQKKCLRTMDDLHSGGRTVIFVSHNMAAIENLCPRTMWIDKGQLRDDGPTGKVIRAYMSTFGDAEQGSVDLENVEARRGNGDARFTRFEFLNSNGEPVQYVRSGDHLTIRLHFRVHRTIRDFHAGIEFLTELGLKLVGTNNWATGFDVANLSPGEGYIDLEIDFLNFLPGRYYLSLFMGPAGNIHDVIENAVILDVESSDYYKSGRGMDRRFGLVFLPSRWKSDNLPRN